MIKFPEERPETVSQGMQGWITRHYRPGERPVVDVLNQSGLSGIVDDVKADSGERVAFALFFAQNMVVGLMLESVRKQCARKVFTEKLHPFSLVGFEAQPHPDDVRVIWHQTIGWAE